LIRKVLLILVLLATIGVAALYLPLDFLRPAVERALERGLLRKVEIGHVYVNLFGVPGFTFENVTIHEDSRAGIEPFAYVPSLDAGVNALGLFRRKLIFSNISLGDATINVVKTTDGVWNFQLLAQNASGARVPPPSVKMRGGRVNFKFGDLKSVFYFNEADLDVTPYSNGSLELRFGGAPSRTDRAAQDFGHFFVRGNWNSFPAGYLDARVELERGSLDEILRFIDPNGFGLQGFVTVRTHLSGPPGALQLAGSIQLEDVHRWDQVARHQTYAQELNGRIDLTSQKVELATATEAAISLLFRGSDFLGKPQWETRVRLQRMPLGDVLDIGRQIGAEFPDKLSADGAVSAEIAYNRQTGFAGGLELTDATLTLPEAKPLRAASAAVSISDGTMQLAPTTVELGEKESADIEGSYRLESPRRLDLKIATRGLGVADMRSFKLLSIPLLNQTAQGSWRGWVRYRDGEWSGEYDLQNARVAIGGIAEPLRIQSALVRLNDKRVIVSRLKARAGKIALTGDYRWDPQAVRPHKFTLAFAEVSAGELGRLLAPAFDRQQGFLARTLRLAPSPLPAWLKDRRADGAISISAFAIGDTVVRVGRARLLWDATLIRLVSIDGHVLDADADQAAIGGDMEISLDRGAPRFKFDGTLADVPYKTGALDFEGSFEADGIGSQFLETARAEGRVHGRSINFGQDAEFKTGTGCFLIFGLSAGMVWKLSDLELLQNGELYTGTGLSQPDGKLVLDLSRGGRPVRFATALAAFNP
jgi:hypothetical protein